MKTIGDYHEVYSENIKRLKASNDALLEACSE